MTLIDKLKIPVLVAGLGLALAGCRGGDENLKSRLASDYNKARAEVVLQGQLTDKAIRWLNMRGVPAESVKVYDKRFLSDFGDIETLFNSDVMPGIANGYNERFNARDIVDLNEIGINPEIANGYDERFGVYAISNFYRDGISPELANSYDQKIFRTSGEIINATSADLDNETALEYDERFSANERTDLYANDVYPNVANAYHKSFSDEDIIKLHKKEGIPPKRANRYARLYAKYRIGIDAEDVTKFINNKVPFSVIEERVKEFNKAITE